MSQESINIMIINALNVFSFVVYVKMCEILSRFYVLDDAKIKNLVPQ